jgi:hypothetical protein
LTDETVSKKKTGSHNGKKGGNHSLLTGFLPLILPYLYHHSILLSPDGLKSQITCFFRMSLYMLTIDRKTESKTEAL